MGLEAAHNEGVVHRDLKPQNIMVDGSGRVYLMDFGIAKSMELAGMTRTGVLMGTPDYMSPEQAKGEKADSRSDLFTVGVIFYELLTGQQPYRSETVMQTLVKRTKERATPTRELDPSIPAIHQRRGFEVPGDRSRPPVSERRADPARSRIRTRRSQNRPLTSIPIRAWTPARSSARGIELKAYSAKVAWARSTRPTTAISIAWWP